MGDGATLVLTFMCSLNSAGGLISKSGFFDELAKIYGRLCLACRLIIAGSCVSPATRHMLMLHYAPRNFNLKPMLDRTLNVAPMMGCTDRHCRYLLRLLSPNSLLYSEMIVTGALLRGYADHFLEHQEDEPTALQLGGSDPDDLAMCAVKIEHAGYQEVNLNVGCPSDRVQSGGIGACLMADPELVARCYSAMQSKVSIPVTIKCRIGIDDDDSFEFFHRFVQVIHEAGCRTFIVHARKAVLHGFSPKDNREIPPLKYDYVSRIQAIYPDTVFVLNGGLKSSDQVAEQLDNAHGVMLGRAVYSNPFLLAELDNQIYQTTVPTRRDIVAQLREYMERQIAKGTHVKYMSQHLLGLFTGIPGARAYRRHLSENMFAQNAGIEVFDGAVAQIHEWS